jgi:hypothetical protein
MYLKDLLILGNSRDPRNQFVVVLKLCYVTVCTPSPVSPISFRLTLPDQQAIYSVL